MIARLGYTGPWLFTQLLLPALLAATNASLSHEKARVVTVSSSANYLTTGIDYYAIADGPERTKYSELELYNKSKFVRSNCEKNRLICRPVSQGNVVVARELARRHGDKIVSTSLHPGNIRTDLQRHFSGWQDALFVRSLIAFSGKIADSWTVLDIVPSIIRSTHIALLRDVTRCGGR